MTKLQGKVALITGGNSGIGAESAKLFAKEGADIVIFGRNQDTLNQVRDEIGGNTLAVQGDVRNLSDLDNLIDQTKEKFGSIDIVFANAGLNRIQPVSDVDEESYDLIQDVNVKGVFFTVQKAATIMNDGGSIVMTASGLDVKPAPGMSVYCASKAAVRHLGRCFAIEFAGRGIRSNVLSPGPIETPIIGRQGIPEDEMRGMFDQFKNMVPLGRIGEPIEMAKAALYLASDDSSYCTGQVLYADGGFANA